MTAAPKREVRDKQEKGDRSRGGSGSRRRAARLAAVQALYQMELTGADAAAVIREFTQHRLGRDAESAAFGEADQALFADLVAGVARQRGDLDGMIAALLTEDWTVERLESTLRAILRAGAYELSARLDIPPRVAISEYVEIAGAFFSGKETGLVNGLLDRMAQSLRPDELGKPTGGGTAFTG